MTLGRVGKKCLPGLKGDIFCYVKTHFFNSCDSRCINILDEYEWDMRSAFLAVSHFSLNPNPGLSTSCEKGKHPKHPLNSKDYVIQASVVRDIKTKHQRLILDRVVRIDNGSIENTPEIQYSPETEFLMLCPICQAEVRNNQLANLCHRFLAV